MRVTRTVEVDQIFLDTENPVASLRDQLGLTHQEIGNALQVSKQCAQIYSRYGKRLRVQTLDRIVSGLGYLLVFAMKYKRRKYTLSTQNPVQSIRTQLGLKHAEIGEAVRPSDFSRQDGYKLGRDGLKIRLATLVALVGGLGGTLEISVTAQRRRRRAS